ncbi:MAG: response regulator transcription factor, partial [Microbacterium sp.]
MRMGFRTILEATGDIVVVGEAATGAEAVAAASALDPDVICMDVQMPGMDGLEATRMIVADAEVDAAVIVVTTFDRDDYLFAALDAGASGFLLKNAGADELTAAVRVVAAGDALLAPEVTRRVIERFAAPSVPSAASPPHASPTVPWPVADALTEREVEVLRLVAQARSNAEIARELFIGEATVKT